MYQITSLDRAKPGLGGEGLQERQAACGEPFNVTPHCPGCCIKII